MVIPEKLFHGGKRPERRVALTPEAFVEQHTFHHQYAARCFAAARRCFMAQLGKPFNVLERHGTTLKKRSFAIFGLQYFPDDRKAALKLMDTLNLSCRIKSKRDSGKFCTPVYSLAKSAFQRVIKKQRSTAMAETTSLRPQWAGLAVCT